MAPIRSAALMVLFAAVVVAPANAQFQNPQAERPIINGFRQLTTNNLFTDAAQRFSQNSPLSGKLCPKCASKRNARFKELAEDKEILRASQKASLEKLQEEAKKAKFEAKALEEADFEKHKPWDVAAPENLESPSPLLQAAAATKQDQDLAPKKIRALEYIAMLGCNKDPKVEAAILAGLQDHNQAVRWAAIQAVIASARGPMPYVENPFGDKIVPTQPVNSMIDPLKFGLEEEGYPAKEPGGDEKEEVAAEPPAPACNECQNCKKRKPCLQRLKGLCKRCKGHGCRGCNYCGHEIAPCEVCPPIEEVPCEECVACQAHDGCISCCPSPAIMEELKKIATESDPDRPGCYFEPSIDVRNLALEALNVCPPLPEDKQGGKDDPDIIEGGDDTKKKKDIIETNPDADDNDADGPTPDLNSPNGETRNRVGSLYNISHRRSVNENDSRFGSGPVGNDQSELLMSARIAKFYTDGFLIEFQDDYLIPVGKQLLVQLSDGRTHIVSVVKSETGFTQVRPVDGNVFNIPSTKLSVGVIQ
ncbi:MAG: HEAT repeat domain-containing protein [Planctomycetota bacterium]